MKNLPDMQATRWTDTTVQVQEQEGPCKRLGTYEGYGIQHAAQTEDIRKEYIDKSKNLNIN